VRKSYLFVYSGLLGDRERLKAILNSLPQVLLWRYDLPSAFYIVSESSADEIARAIRQAVGKKGRFIVTELGPNKQGWLTPESWYIINNKTRKPKP